MRLGLRWKSALAVSLSAALVLGLSALIAARAVRSVQENLGEAFARNATQFNKQRLLTPVARELALSQRLADSQTLARWLQAPNDPAARSLFFREAEGYRRAFADQSYFVADIERRAYYFNDTKTPYSEKARQIFDPKSAADAWFFASVKNTQTYNLNVDFNAKRHETKVWINVVHREHGRKVAIAGTGLDLTQFLQTFISRHERGVTPIIINEDGAIQAHPNARLIALNSGSGGNASSTLFDLVHGDANTLKGALQRAKAQPDGVQLVAATLDDKPQLLAVSYLPELHWHVVTAVDLNAAHLVDSRALALPLALGAATLVALLVLVAFAVNRLVVTPILRLTRSVRQVEGGNYNVTWPRAADDEIGDLTHAFETMTTQIRSHTDELETLVAQRTHELREAGQHIRDSIQYASLIQSAILPERELKRAFGERCDLLWLPRDVVGGDLYLFRQDASGTLVGLVDCAGHGVAGAFMTMIAHAAFQSAVEDAGLSDPAKVLTLFDRKVRATLGETGRQSGIATNMDASLVFFPAGRDELFFCGAHLDLFACDAQGHVSSLKGSRAPLGGKKAPDLRNQKRPLAPDERIVLSTDGFLDQAGGERGFSFGVTRFKALLARTATLSLQEQSAALATELSAYRGDRPQRDDIGVLVLTRPLVSTQDVRQSSVPLYAGKGFASSIQPPAAPVTA